MIKRYQNKKTTQFLSSECIKCRLQNVGHFVNITICQLKVNQCSRFQKHHFHEIRNNWHCGLLDTHEWTWPVITHDDKRYFLWKKMYSFSFNQFLLVSVKLTRLCNVMGQRVSMSYVSISAYTAAYKYTGQCLKITLTKWRKSRTLQQSHVTK